MLSENIDSKDFISRLRKKNKQNICKVLMDQSVVCGVGNYVKADSLWLSRINPFCLVSDLKDSELIVLSESIKKVLRESYNSSGTTIGIYKNLDSKKDSYSSDFLVYNRKIDLEGNKVAREQTPDGRTTHWSPRYQTIGSWAFLKL